MTFELKFPLSLFVTPPNPWPLVVLITVSGKPDCATKTPFTDQLFSSVLPTLLDALLGRSRSQVNATRCGRSKFAGPFARRMSFHGAGNRLVKKRALSFPLPSVFEIVYVSWNVELPMRRFKVF